MEDTHHSAIPTPLILAPEEEQADEQGPHVEQEQEEQAYTSLGGPAVPPMNSSCAGEVRTGDKKRKKKKWGQGYTNYAYYYHEAYGKRLASDADESREQGQHEPRIAIRDWNNEFQTIVSDLARCGDDDGKLERCNMLSSLAHDFVYAAKVYGKIIILERFLPSSQKTIKPVNIGGTAGGEKYICQGILFKFAVDSVGLYGGDEYSQKAAGHELKGLVGYYQCQIQDLHVPLCTLIDYRGFRLIAMSILPLYYGGLIYGSNDGGMTVHADDPKMNQTMKRAAKKMNIKGHVAGRSQDRKMLYGPTDIEGHKGTDDRYYLLDFARVYPPEAMPEGSPKASYLYCLLRPEFVKKNPVPLSSDAFSRFGQHDKEIHDCEVVEATQRLHRKVIPRFATWLDKQDERRLKGLKLTQLMHREGINMRHLGRLRALVNSKPVKQLILHEMLSRAIKCNLRLMLRRKMEETKLPSEEPYRRVLIDYFNLILGKRLESDHFWKVEIKRMLSNKFADGLTVDEAAPDYNLKKDASMLTIFTRLQVIMGVRLAAKALQQLATNPAGLSLVYPDLLKISARAKHMDIISHAEGAALCIQAMHTKGEESDRLYNLAMSKFDTALSSTPDNQLILKNWGDALCEQMKNKTGEERDRLVWKAIDKYQQMRCTTSLMKLGDLLRHLVSNQTAEERGRLQCLIAATYSAATELRPDSWQAFYGWGDILYEQARSKAGDEADKLYHLSGEKYARAFALNPDLHTCSSSKLDPTLHQSSERAAGDSASSTSSSPSAVLSNRMQIEPLSPSTDTAKYGDDHTKDGKSADLTYDVYNAFEDDDETNLSLSLSSIMLSNSSSLISTIRLGSHSTPSMPANPLPTPTFSLSTPPSPSPSPPASPVRINSTCSGSSTFIPQSLFSLPSISRDDVDPCSLTSEFSPTYSTHSSSTLFFEDLGTKSSSPTSSPSLSSCTSPSSCDSPASFLSSSSLSSLSSSPLSPCSPFLSPRSSDGSSALEGRDLAQLVKLAQRCPSFEEIDSMWTNQQLSNSVLAFISQRYGSQLKTLKLTGCNGLTAEAFPSVSWRRPLFPELKHLDLSGSSVTNEILLHILKQCPSLQTLDLRGCGMIGAASSARAYGANISAFASLRQIDLSDCRKLSPEVMLQVLPRCVELKSLSLALCSTVNVAVIAQIAAHCTQMESMDLSGCRIDDPALFALSKCTKLRSLKLNACTNITNKAISEVAARCPELQTCSLAGCEKLTDAGVISLAKHCPSLTVLDLSCCKSITNFSVLQIAERCSSLQSLGLANCQAISDEAITALSQRCPNLQAILLGGAYKITDQALVQMVSRVATKLHVISLAGCDKISSVAVTAIAQSCPNLRVLNLSDCTNVSNESLTQLLRNCKSLVKLNLSRCKDLRSEVLVAAQCYELQQLVLSWCPRISASAVVQLVKNCSALRVLDLSECKQITDDALTQIAHSCPYLEVINLANATKITDLSIVHVAQCCINLKALVISGCYKVTDAGMIKVARHCSALQIVRLGRCYKVTDAGVMKIAAHCPLLQTITLNGCRQISDTSILHLARSCKHLKQLGLDSTNQVSRHVLLEIKKTFPRIATKTRP